MPKDKARQRVAPVSLFFLCTKTGTTTLPRPERRDLLLGSSTGDLDMNIGAYKKYCTEIFGIETWDGKIRDKRKRPVISNGQIFHGICQMPVLGQGSFLAWDEFAKTPEARKWHGSNRAMVASDSSLERIAGGMERRGIEEIGYEVTDKADEQALWDTKLPSGKKLRLGIVDGHHAGGIWASVLAVSGKSDGVVDLERYPKRGCELEASRTVLKRAFGKLGKGFFGIVAGDGLYATKEDFQLCLDHGSHLLVKTDEETLTVIQDAKHLFRVSYADKLEGVFQQKGQDPKRCVDYEVMWAEGFEWQGHLLTAAWVKEWALNSKTGIVEHTEFWVLTTATGFTGENLRELAHLRWEIENNIFKRLSYLIGSKRTWSHKPNVMETLLRIWMIGLTLLGAYLFERGWKKFEETWQTMKSTWRTVTRLMMRSLHQLVT
jgi:hypothetical protein